jgi:hypothetical protein
MAVGGPMSLKNAYLAVALMSGLSLAACSNTAAGAKKDAEINKEKAAVATKRPRTRLTRPLKRPPPKAGMPEAPSRLR